MKTDIKKIMGKWHVVIIQGNQSFSLSFTAGKKEVNLYKKLVDKAIKNFTKEINSSTKLQFTKLQFIELLHVLFSESVIISDEIIKHYYSKVQEAGYIKGD